MLIGLTQSGRNIVLKPGPLSSAHAQALSDVSEEKQCASCHDAAEADPIAWMMVAAGSVQSVSDGQATRCLACHDQTLNKEWARFAHNVSPDALAKLTASHFESRAKSDQHKPTTVSLTPSSVNGKQLACSTCHREHHGSHLNLGALTDQQCQTCHSQQFASFEHGHPEFRHTQPVRRGAIAFDHVAHQSKHFPTKQKTFSCNQCHEDDARRDVKRLAGFERSCAECHTKPIEAASLDGLAIFSLPTLDIAKLTEEGFDVGAWPAAAQGDFDGSLSPVVRLLLSADDEAALAMERLAPDFDFSQTSSHDYPFVSTLAWSYKRLLNDLANDSHATLQKRLAKVAPGPVAQDVTAVVLHQLPLGLFREARRRWLPELDQELAHSRPAPARIVREISTIYPQVHAQKSNSELLIENPLAKRSNRSQESPDAAVPGITWWSKSDNSAPLPATAPPTTLPSETKPSNDALPATSAGELLAENPLRQSVPSRSVELASPPQIDSPPSLAEAQTSPDPVEPSDPIELSEPVEPSPAMETQPVEQPRPSDPIDLASSGSWYLDDETLAVRYRPRGHSDQWLALLLNVAASATHPQAPQHGLLPSLLRESSFKSCTSCHSIDAATDHYVINWRTYYRDTSRRQFTEFSHRPHLVQPRLADCTKCHVLNNTSQGLTNYDTTEPRAIVHDFQPITKSNCVTCHTQAEAGGRCTLCHSYHVGAVRGTGK